MIFLITLIILNLASGQRLDLQLGKNLFEFKININDKPWFSQDLSIASDIFISSNWNTLSVKNGSLQFKDGQLLDDLSDKLGEFSMLQHFWNPESLGFETSVKIYKNEPMLVFTQNFTVSKYTHKIRVG